jgi:hypothetical protein
LYLEDKGFRHIYMLFPKQELPVEIAYINSV